MNSLCQALCKHKARKGDTMPILIKFIILLCPRETKKDYEILLHSIVGYSNCILLFVYI